MAELDKIEQASALAAQDEDVKAYAKEIDVARALSAVKDTDGGKQLVQTLSDTIITSLQSLRSMPDNWKEHCLKIDFAMATLEKMYTADGVVEEYQERLDELVKTYIRPQ